MEKYDKKKENMINRDSIMAICNEKVLEPENGAGTWMELYEAMKLFDTNKDDHIDLNELRWAMT